MGNDVGSTKVCKDTPTDLAEKQHLLLDEMEKLKGVFAGVSAEIRTKVAAVLPSSV